MLNNDKISLEALSGIISSYKPYLLTLFSLNYFVLKKI